MTAVIPAGIFRKEMFVKVRIILSNAYNTEEENPRLIIRCAVFFNSRPLQLGFAMLRPFCRIVVMLYVFHQYDGTSTRIASFQEPHICRTLSRVDAPQNTTTSTTSNQGFNRYISSL